LSDLIYTGALFGIYALVTQASFRTLKIKEQNS
jgi:hypothetical protein